MKYISVIRPKGWNLNPGNNEGIFSNIFVSPEKGEQPIYTCRVAELAWRNNQHDISCIPLGVYPLNLLFSAKHNMKLYHVMGVQGRDENGNPANVEQHIGNYAGDKNVINPATGKLYLTDILGCMILGQGIGVLNSQQALLQSTQAFEDYMKIMGGENAMIEISEAA